MTDLSANTTADPAVEEDEPSFGDFFALLKPRVMSLVIFTALVGLIAAPGTVHPVIGFASLLFIAIGAGASGALNMWWDADIDQVMRRTAARPIPAGKLSKEDARNLGIALSVLSVAMLALSSNIAAAALLAFTIFFYAVIYTMWLKRATPQNIVIGGAAGAFPPVIGWLVATGTAPLEAWLLFALIFMWTPPHFWALALFTKSDYGDAGIPMLTVTHGPVSTRRHILVYTALLAALCLGMSFTSLAGPSFIISSLVLNLLFLRGAIQILRRDQEQAIADSFAVERQFFKLSLLYLFVLFAAIALDATLLHRWGI